ncbi:helix-turn-helix domain-containing protein [Muricoccus aerilatus]|uniref:helix-turn-helix domain-containing protein n=1 Tax=Muricoccus aerilatus TaxID=452982 RepID=UPI0012EBA8BD|nr:helix-turn-helix transcriptional regulator [Roseomonas aerilata]
MTLDSYLGPDRGSVKALAQKVGVSTVAIWRWRTGKARPSWPMLDKLSAATEGKVTAADFAVSAEAA